jgi:hypothetical protein
VTESAINPLEYYAQHSIMTDPRERADLLADLAPGTCFQLLAPLARGRKGTISTAGALIWPRGGILGR